ncbi:MAG: metal ABC transporter permease [Comamonadaceae bacterium]|nr:metal ABC transporter permease [Comamonadaceae bacterium]
MISDFLASWDLFATTYLAGWIIGLLLSIIGVFLVARNQIFVAAAVSQASALGVSVALILIEIVPAFQRLGLHDLLGPCLAIFFSIAASLATMGKGGAGRESPEALTGLVYLSAASLSIIVLAKSPHGLDEINRLLSSSIVGATERELVIFYVFAVMTIAVVAAFRHRLILLAMDPLAAAAAGMRTRLYEFAIALWIGLAVGLSIRAAGVLFTFGCLILPALAAKAAGRRIAPLFFTAPVICLVALAISFVMANHLDIPPGQMAVAVLCASVLIAWVARFVRIRL